MPRLNAMVVAFVAFSLVTACNQGEFTGSGSKKEVTAAKKDEAAKSPDTDKRDKNDDLGNPSKDDNDNGPSDNAENNKGSTGDTNVNDVLNGLLGGDDDESGHLDSNGDVVYGGNKIFHIGDSRMDGSTCNSVVAALSTAGRRYYFEFQVKEAGTTVTINVNKICGVDYSDSNVLAIAHSGSYVKEQKLVKDATNATITSDSLEPGRYAVAIESRVSAEAVGEAKAANDVDDYLVGEVRIKGSRPIAPGKAGAK